MVGLSGQWGSVKAAEKEYEAARATYDEIAEDIKQESRREIMLRRRLEVLEQKREELERRRVPILHVRHPCPCA